MKAILTLFAMLMAIVAVPLPAHAAAQGPRVIQVLEPGTELEPGEYLWNPELGAAGAIEIVVDLDAERMYVYRGGAEIGRTLIIYGDDGKPTPTGEFRILEKKRDHISNIYHLPMPWMMRLTWGGIAIHGSGSEVDGRYATHGCIGVPDEFAELLFGVTPKGARVTVTRGWMREVYG
ncbi:L,D-transpeptidase family protein [Sphingomonas canadensis]|uniref:L,D-transpeptidase family protein n=1 Tax=Sphingomonas canadensis TaxID=1219257 RepID=A0ABW3H305_9SPHN|nr:L,D-transpeptidase family protein [Sphingomonas canadensis]MCW3835785.1 L,D-transpeptidase family protein [Sphingomonas canadensis]